MTVGASKVFVYATIGVISILSSKSHLGSYFEEKLYHDNIFALMAADKPKPDNRIGKRSTYLTSLTSFCITIQFPEEGAQ